MALKQFSEYRPREVLLLPEAKLDHRVNNYQGSQYIKSCKKLNKVKVPDEVISYHATLCIRNYATMIGFQFCNKKCQFVVSKEREMQELESLVPMGAELEWQ